MKDLGLDSLDQVEIIMAMEDEFGLYLLQMFKLRSWWFIWQMWLFFLYKPYFPLNNLHVLIV